MASFEHQDIESMESIPPHDTRDDAFEDPIEAFQTVQPLSQTPSEISEDSEQDYGKESGIRVSNGDSSEQSNSTNGDPSSNDDEVDASCSDRGIEPQVNSNADTNKNTPTDMQRMMEMMDAMQRKLQEMETKINNSTPSTPSLPNPPPPPPASLPAPTGERPEEKVEIDPHIETRIDSFKASTAATPKPITLKGASNYEDWKESVLTQVQALACIWILEKEEQECPPTLESRKQLWDIQNEWLYKYIFESLHPNITFRLDGSQKRSAYLLWAEIESKFNQSIEEERRCLFQKLCTLKASNDIEYIIQFKELRMKLGTMGFMVPDWIAQDFLWAGLSETSRDFIQMQIESERRSKYTAVTLDTNKLTTQILNHLMPLENGYHHQPVAAAAVAEAPAAAVPRKSSVVETASVSSKSSTSVPQQQHQFNNPDNKPDKLVCTYCEMEHHTADRCYYRNSEKMSAKWQNDHRTGIAYFRKRAEDRQRLNNPQNRSWRLPCEYCGQKGHSPHGCQYKYPEMRPAAWRKENKHLIEYFVRKENMRKRMTAQSVNGQRADASPTYVARPASPPNLMDM